jgi:hypothetical protein
MGKVYRNTLVLKVQTNWYVINVMAENKSIKVQINGNSQFQHQLKKISKSSIKIYKNKVINN